MPPDIVHEDNPALARIARKTTPAAALAALGIVYGDLGTSPLYTLQAVVGATGGHFSPEAALGSLSLIFWALIITISVKYCLFVMRADNHGEGGILAADVDDRRELVRRPAHPHRHGAVRGGAALRRRHHHASDLGIARPRRAQRRTR